MKFLRPENEHKELTYQDVFLVPRYSDISSRMDTDLTPPGGTGMRIPVVVANMTAVAGRRMTETITRRGGLVVLTQDMSFDRVKHIVEYTKKCHHVFETPVVLDQNETVQTALNLIHKRAHGAVIIVDSENRPVGIFTEKDAYRRDRYSILKDVMTKDLITVPSTMDPKDIFEKLVEARLSIVPVINGDGTLAGVMTKKGAVRASMYSPAVNSKNELLTCVAVRIRSGLEESITQLANIDVDVIVLDTAHGHQQRMLDAIIMARRILGPNKTIVAGNIVTAEAAEAFIDAGANILKVGVGPGGACKTRMTTGVGRPQFSAVHRVSQVAKRKGAQVWADGGIKHPRDVALALAAGASAGMVGSWFAGTYESPADVQYDENGRMYKEQYGMASRRAVTNRKEKTDAFLQARKEFFEEGVNQSKMYLKEGQESVEDILDEITAGVRSAFTYMGAKNVTEFHENSLVGVQSASGYDEGRPVKESW